MLIASAPMSRYRNCPKCKKPRRALKALTLSRLPPILLIHLKRFSFHGPFTDKINTAVVFPVNALDLSPYMPPALDPAVEAQYASKAGGHGLEKVPRPVYDLHAISNHFGSLSSGHCGSAEADALHRYHHVNGRTKDS